MNKQASNSVVIFGGGVAGAVLAKELSRHVDVTLVDPQEYFEVPMAAPRCMVSPEFAEKAIISFAEALPRVRHIRAKLVEMRSDGGVIVDAAGKESVVSGMIEVLATGSRFANPLMRSAGDSIDMRREFYRTYNSRLKMAQNVLIVGGGPIGVEVAGEITEIYPEKSVSILDSGSRLMRGTSASAAAHAQQFLDVRGVKIYLNERLVSSSSSHQDALAPGGEAKTSSGRTIRYDLLIWAGGGAPNTNYMHHHLADVLNDRGQIKVKPTLQVVGFNRLFALGDVTDLDENKMAWHIAGQVKVAKANILAALKGKDATAGLKRYKPKTGSPMMAVTLGSQAGVVQLPVIGTIRSAQFSRSVKAKDMLVPKFRKALLG